MKLYLSYFKVRFIASLQYRASALSSIATQIFFGLINASIYIAFFKSGSTNAPMSLQQTITYVWLNQSFYFLICKIYKDSELLDIVRNGNIAYELARPTSIYCMWYFKIYASRLAGVALRFIPVAIIAILLPPPFNISFPESIQNFCFFIISMFLGSLISTGISTLHPIIVLKTLSEKGVSELFIAVNDILSGIPLPYYPRIIQIISSLLPFQYVSDLAFRIYVGNITGISIIEGILMQLFWIIALIIIGNILLTNSLKRVVVQGD